MPKTIKLKLLTPSATVLEKEVDQVVAETVEGEIGVLPNHIPLVTPLSEGLLKYWESGDTKVAAVLGGIMEVSKESVTIISDHAALAEDIDEVQAKKEKEKTEARLSHNADKCNF